MAKTTCTWLLVLLGTALGCSTTPTETAGGAPDGGADGAGSAAKRVPWDEGCGDAASCSFLFHDWRECIRSKCSTEIEACGADGAECARGLRCADDLMAADYASGCLTGANVSSWVCYENRFACQQDLASQPPAMDLVRCVYESDCLPKPGIGECALPSCSSAPPESACATCLRETCSCRNETCARAIPCIETCRKDSCEAATTNDCQLRCTKEDLEASIYDVYQCVKESCSAECCR
ncbi:MAG: hypothetical protein KF850_17310 [Labilithrix sp.]|nr:hypothetical protein [Labilithrix sp.]MBX3213802.1 hypothetical protein [Labilithrix sp.]